MSARVARVARVVRLGGSALVVLLSAAVAAAAPSAAAETGKSGKSARSGSAGVAGNAANVAAANTWHPPGCPVLAGGPKGQTKMKVGGPCEADWMTDAECENEIDDLTFISRRKVKDGAEMVVYINVERYAGAGVYKPPNDFYVSVMKDKSIWRWSSHDFEATIGPGSKYVQVKDVKLEPELLLVGCTGPQTNYQCDGRGDDPKHMASLTTLSGILFCKAAPKKKK